MSSYIKAAAQCNPNLLKKAKYNEHEAATTFLRDPTSSFLSKDDPNTAPAPPLPPYCVYRSNHRLQELSHYDTLRIKRNIQQMDEAEAMKTFGYGRPGGHLVNGHDPIKGVRLAEGGASKGVNLYAPIVDETVNTLTYKSEGPSFSNVEDDGVVDELFSGRRSPFAHRRHGSANNSPQRAGGARRTVGVVLAQAHTQQQQQLLSDGPTFPPINDPNSTVYGKVIPVLEANAELALRRRRSGTPSHNDGADTGKRALVGRRSKLRNLNNNFSSVASTNTTVSGGPSLTASEASVLRKKLTRIAQMDALHEEYRRMILAECEPSKVAPRPYRTLPEPF